MATKVYDSPTTNIFDILADEGDNQSRKTKSAAAKANDDLTPKERAAAKAVQDAERKAKREAEKAKKAEEAAKEAARKKALEDFDDSGFSQQRHQRVKETRLQERAPVESPKAKKDKTEEKGEVKAKGEKKQFKGEKKPFKGDKGPKGDKPAKVNKGEGNHEGRAPRREFDRHSQGVTSRHVNPKKQGQGKGNWGGAVPTGLNTDVQHALASEELAAPVNETEGWGEAPVQSEAATGEVADVPAEGAEVAEGEEAVVEEEEEKQVTLEEYQLIQAEKKKALEALVGSAQPRELTEDEKKAVAKFTLVENEKTKKANKAAQAKPVSVVTPGARKGEKAVALDAYVQIRVAGPRTDRPRGRGGRFEGQREGQREGPRGGNNQRKGGRAAPQKIPKGKDAFPTLG